MSIAVQDSRTLGQKYFRNFRDQGPTLLSYSRTLQNLKLYGFNMNGKQSQTTKSPNIEISILQKFPNAFNAVAHNANLYMTFYKTCLSPLIFKLY